MSYGYGLSASLFQLARAYTVFARDGELIPVTILRQGQLPVEALAGAAAAALDPASAVGAGQRVMDRRQTAQQVRTCCAWPPAPAALRPRRRPWAIRWAARPAPRTSRKARATPKKYRAWFVGLAPGGQPAHRGGGDGGRAQQGAYFGGDVAAPVFSQVVQQTLRMMNVSTRPGREGADQCQARAGRARELLTCPPRCKPPGGRTVAGRARDPAAGRTLHADSREVRPGDGFIAWPGAMPRRPPVCGCRAGCQGAAACLVEADGAEAFGWTVGRVATLCGAEGGRRGHGRHLLCPTQRGAGRGGQHRHQWQDQHRLVDGAGAHAAGPALRCHRHAGGGQPPSAGPPGASSTHRPDHARPGAAARHLSQFCRPGFCAPARWKPRPSALPNTAWRRRANPAWRCSPTSRVTIWTTTAAWPPTGPPSASCLPGRACARRWSTWTTRGRRAGEVELSRAAQGRWTSGHCRCTAPARLQRAGYHYVNGGLAFTVLEGSQTPSRAHATGG
jgi:hypothetical protein